MQKNQLQLKEIIYEITEQCNNGCVYCGSSSGRCKPTSNLGIKNIVNQIAKYPPEEINISGGDPLLVDLKTHEYVVRTLKSKKVVCKIIVNPKSFSANNLKILKLYDYIGVSINNAEELKAFMERYNIHLYPKTTIITNFNLTNIFIYDELDKMVRSNNFMWQIQFTVFKEKNDIALYENEDCLIHLQKKLDVSVNNGTKIVLADNMNEGQCSAGMYSCGILADGTVVPCLSMRSWIEDVKSVSQGNLFTKNGLKDIWENTFFKYRFDCFKCCKDHCGNKKLKLNVPSYPMFNVKMDQDGTHIEPILRRNPIITMYGVRPNEVMVYGVSTPNTMAYAVSPNTSIIMYGISTSYTTTSATYDNTNKIKKEK